MPKLGEIRCAQDIGQKGRNELIWHACIDCGKERWVNHRHGIPRSKRCCSCANRTPERREDNRLALLGKKPYNWKGGRHISHGYVMVWVAKDDFFRPMATLTYSYVLEHRLVMAKHLNRCLLPWEIVHHKNGIRDDNRLENLDLVKGHHNHAAFSALQRENIKLRARIRQLETLPPVLTGIVMDGVCVALTAEMERLAVKAQRDADWEAIRGEE